MWKLNELNNLTCWQNAQKIVIVDLTMSVLFCKQKIELVTTKN
jgi:hypothetical protein